MTAETDIAAIADGGDNPPSRVRDALTSVLGRADAASGARVYDSTNTTLSDSTTISLEFDSETRDDEGYHDTVTNTERLTAPRAGWYQVGAGVIWGASSAGWRSVGLRVNASSTIARSVIGASAEASTISQAVATAYYLDAGDYVEVRVRQTSGGDLDVVRTADYSPEFWIVTS